MRLNVSEEGEKEDRKKQQRKVCHVEKRQLHSERKEIASKKRGSFLKNCPTFLEKRWTFSEKRGSFFGKSRTFSALLNRTTIPLSQKHFWKESAADSAYRTHSEEERSEQKKVTATRY
jgi:hypothetical protein